MLKFLGAGNLLSAISFSPPLLIPRKKKDAAPIRAMNKSTFINIQTS